MGELTYGLSWRETRILVGVLTSREELRALRGGELPADRKERGRLLTAIEDAEGGAVRVDPEAWLGREPTASDGVLMSRCYAKLEDKGLIVRLYWGKGYRTTHLALSDMGERLAWELATAPGDATLSRPDLATEK